jgi:hypothetical protein
MCMSNGQGSFEVELWNPGPRTLDFFCYFRIRAPFHPAFPSPSARLFQAQRDGFRPQTSAPPRSRTDSVRLRCGVACCQRVRSRRHTDGDYRRPRPAGATCTMSANGIHNVSSAPFSFTYRSIESIFAITPTAVSSP